MDGEEDDRTAGPPPSTGVDAKPAARASARRSRGRGRFVLRATALLFVATLIGAGLLFGRLSSSPLFTEIGADAVAAEIEAALPKGGDASVGVIGLSLDDGLQPILHLRDVQVIRPGEPNVSVDTLAIGVSWSTVFGGAADLNTVVAEHVFLAAREEDPPPSLPDILAIIDKAVAATGVDYLDVGALTLERRGLDGSTRTIIRSVAVTAEASPAEGISAKLAGAGVEGPWAINARLEPVADGPVREVIFSAEGFDVGDVVLMAGDERPGIAGPITMSGRLGFDADWKLATGEGEVTVGPLSETTERTAAVLTERSRLKLRWRPEDRTVVVDPSTLVLPEGHAILQGAVGTPADEETSWRFDLRAGGQTGSRSAAARVVGSYDPEAHRFIVDQLTGEGAGVRFDAAMRVDHAGDRVVGALSGIFPSLPVPSLKQIWPHFLSPEARSWVFEHVHDGTILEATVDLGFTGGDSRGRPGADASLAFRFEDAVFRPYREGPLIRGASGSGTLTADRLELTLQDGVADMENGRTLDLAPSRFVIPAVTADPPVGEIDVAFEGPADAAGALWQRIPVSRRVDLGFDPLGLAGQVSAKVRLDLPLVKDLKAEDVRYDGTLVTRDLSVGDPVEGRRVRDGELTIAVRDGAATITGTADVDGVAADIDIVRPLEGGAGARSTVRLELDAAARARLGFDVGDAVKGTILARIEAVTTPDGDDEQVVTLDLTPATISIPGGGFTKAKGKAGSATFVVAKKGGGLEVRDVVATIGSARLEGGLTLDGRGRVTAASFPLLRLSAKDSLSLRIQRNGDTTRAVLRGSRFDATGLIGQRLKSSGGTDGIPDHPIELDIELGTVIGLNEERLSGLNVAARLEGGVVAALSMTTQTAGGGATSATLTPVQGGRRLQAEVGEVGRLLRFLGLYRRVFGGRATVSGGIEPDGTVRLTVDGRRWKIVEEPALARLSTAAPDGPTAGYATADIERLQGDLSFGNGVLTINDGLVRSTSAGLTLQGDVDFRRDTLRLAGSYLPASAFDSLLGKIPILGQTVFAGGRAGLIGVAFRLTGPIDEPALSVNPLSVIAPGIFRRLFELK